MKSLLHALLIFFTTGFPAAVVFGAAAAATVATTALTPSISVAATQLFQPNKYYAPPSTKYKNPGDRVMNLLDVYLPSEPKPGAKAPSVILFHGGGFAFGVKEDISNMARALQARGITVFNVNYRLGNPENPEKGYYLPEPYKDAEFAMRWIREHAFEFGIDPNGVVTMGYSAGGTIAFHLATTMNWLVKAKRFLLMSSRIDFLRKTHG